MADGICVILSDWWLCADKGCWYDRVVANNYFCQSITKGSWLEYTQERARAHYFWKRASWDNPDWNGLRVSLMQAAQSRPRYKVRQGCLALYPVQSWKTLRHGTCTTSLGHVLLPSLPASFLSPLKKSEPCFSGWNWYLLAGLLRWTFYQDLLVKTTSQQQCRNNCHLCLCWWGGAIYAWAAEQNWNCVPAAFCCRHAAASGHPERKPQNFFQSHS